MDDFITGFIVGLMAIPFGVGLLSTLNFLKEKGLLTSENYGKAKIYAPAIDAEPKIRSVINEHIQARKLLNHYLQQGLTIEEVS